MRKSGLVFVSLLLCLAALPGLPGSARAQGLNAIDIVNGTKAAIPIAVVPFGKETAGLAPSTDVADVVRKSLPTLGLVEKDNVVNLGQRAL